MDALQQLENESEADIEAEAGAGGSYEAALQLPGSFPEPDTSTKSKAATDPFQDEEHLASDRTLEKRIRLQAKMFDVFDNLVDSEDVAVDAYG